MSPSLAVLQSDPHSMWMQTDTERKQVLKCITEKIIEHSIHFQFNMEEKKSTDWVHEYGKQMLSLGCFYLEYSDAIHKGDGDRLLCCWRYFYQSLSLLVEKTTPLKCYTCSTSISTN